MRDCAQVSDGILKKIVKNLVISLEQDISRLHEIGSLYNTEAERKNFGEIPSAEIFQDYLQFIIDNLFFGFAKLLQMKPEQGSRNVQYRLHPDAFTGIRKSIASIPFHDLHIEHFGSIFENLLDYTISYENDRFSLVQEKRYRKKHGVFFTPVWLTSYMVELALKDLVNNIDGTIKTPEEILQLRICDPSSGAGAFLLQSCKYLAEKLSSARNDSVQVDTRKKGYRLIAASCLFGVDINSLAVDVARKSLWLLAGDETLPLTTFDENIKQGNSLLMDWRFEFPGIFSNGRQGFDAVIGNPPYGAFIPYKERSILKSAFPNATDKEVESYWFFMNLALEFLLRDGGNNCFIVPVPWLTLPTARRLRNFIISNCSLERIALPSQETFNGKSVETTVYLAKKKKPGSGEIPVEHLTRSGARLINRITPASIRNNGNFEIFYWVDEHLQPTINSIRKSCVRLGDYFTVSSGYEAYVAGKGQDLEGKRFTGETIRRKIYHSDSLLPGYFPEIKGRSVKHFYIDEKPIQWIRYGPWLSVPRSVKFFTGPRLLIREITGENGRIHAGYTEDELYYSRDVLCILPDKKQSDLKVVLGLLNSKLFRFYNRCMAQKSQKKLFPKVLIKNIADMPIPDCVVDFQRKETMGQKENKHRAEDIQTPSSLSALNALPDEVILNHLNNLVDFKIACRIDERPDLDRILNTLVYRLYGLNEEEVGVIEESFENSARSLS